MDVYLSSESDGDDILLLAAMVDDEENNRIRQKRKCWVHNINRDREVFGEYTTLVPQLKKDPSRFYVYFRMTPECFDEVLDLIADEIRKTPTNFRIPIPPLERFSIALSTKVIV